MQQTNVIEDFEAKAKEIEMDILIGENQWGCMRRISQMEDEVREAGADVAVMRSVICTAMEVYGLKEVRWHWNKLLQWKEISCEDLESLKDAPVEQFLAAVQTDPAKLARYARRFRVDGRAALLQNPHTDMDTVEYILSQQQPGVMQAAARRKPLTREYLDLFWRFSPTEMTTGFGNTKPFYCLAEVISQDRSQRDLAMIVDYAIERGENAYEVLHAILKSSQCSRTAKLRYAKWWLKNCAAYDVGDAIALMRQVGFKVRVEVSA